MKQVLVIAVIALYCAPAGIAQPNRPASPGATSDLARATHNLVQTKLLTPLAKKDRKRSKFSRARLPPQERRVRVLDTEPMLDARGRAFVRFEVDERHGFVAEGEWDQRVMTGCVYPKRKKIYVKKGAGFRSADFLLGKYRKEAPSSTCRSIDNQKVQVSRL